MFIQITAFLSIFQLIFAVDSTNLLLTGSENLSGKNISDDIAVKNIPEQFELLHTINENVRAKMTSLSVYLNYHLTKQRNEMKDDLEELKEAQKQLLRTVESNDPEDFYLNDDIQKFPDEKTTKEPSKETSQSTKKNPTGDGDRKDECSSTAGPWMVIQRRQDGSVDFFRNWVDYKLGFGNLEGEFFIGLDRLHAITSSRIHELWIQMEDFKGWRRWAKYSTFAIGDESQSYALNVLGNFSGNDRDSLRMNQSHKWATKEKDTEGANGCAKLYTGAWWYRWCYESNLNGVYSEGKNDAEIKKTITWNALSGKYQSQKYVHMAIRPVPNRC